MAMAVGCRWSGTRVRNSVGGQSEEEYGEAKRLGFYPRKEAPSGDHVEKFDLTLAQSSSASRHSFVATCLLDIWLGFQPS